MRYDATLVATIGDLADTAILGSILTGVSCEAHKRITLRSSEEESQVLGLAGNYLWHHHTINEKH